MISHEEYVEATRRGEQMRAKTPHAVSARYDRRIGRVVIRQIPGWILRFLPKMRGFGEGDLAAVARD